MEEHGIGTDASMAQHITNVLKRGYVWLDEGSRRLVPAAMGLALAHAYTLVDPGLVLPTVRASIENECACVAKGDASKVDVVARVLRIFERKFQHFRLHISQVPVMLAYAFAQEQGRICEASGEAAQHWEKAVKVTAAMSLQDLL